MKISIGIPTYNERKNISKLLSSIFSQKTEGFELLEVIVIDDGSSDDTVNEARRINDRRLIIAGSQERRGKYSRFNELGKIFKGDVLIQLDADVKLVHDSVLQELVKEQISSGAELVCAHVEPQKPSTFFEKVAYFGGVTWWGRVVDSLGVDGLMYRCQGRARLFTREFLKDFELPASSGEDINSFFYAVQRGYRIAYAPNALIQYRLPSTLRDYIKQSKRFISTPSAMDKFYDKALLNKYYSKTTTQVKIKAFLWAVLRSSPFISSTYVVTQVYAHLTASQKDTASMWSVAASSKELT